MLRRVLTIARRAHTRVILHEHGEHIGILRRGIALRRDNIRTFGGGERIHHNKRKTIANFRSNMNSRALVDWRKQQVIKSERGMNLTSCRGFRKEWYGSIVQCLQAHETI